MMNCKNCGYEVRKINGVYTHTTGSKKCRKLNEAEPILKEIGTFVCENGDNCLHGAGCTLLSFNFENKPKDDPEILLENGIFYCKTWKRG